MSQEDKNKCISGKMKLMRKTSNLWELWNKYDTRWQTVGFRLKFFWAALCTNVWNLILAEQKLLWPRAKENCFLHNKFLNWLVRNTIVSTDLKPNFNWGINIFKRLSHVVIFAVHIYISDSLLEWSFKNDYVQNS